MSKQPRVDTEAIKARLAALAAAKREMKDAAGDENRSYTYTTQYNYQEARNVVAAHAPADIAVLLAENERLQRERSEWCDQADRRLTEQMTQQRDLLAENAALRARLTLTPERIEAAAKAIAALHESPCWDNCYEESWPDADVAARAALLAAGMEEAEQ